MFEKLAQPWRRGFGGGAHGAEGADGPRTAHVVRSLDKVEQERQHFLGRDADAAERFDERLVVVLRRIEGRDQRGRRVAGDRTELVQGRDSLVLELFLAQAL